MLRASCAVAALALTFLVAAAPAGAATATGRVAVRDARAQGALTASARSVDAVTEVAVRGTLTVRRPVRLRAVRCRDLACTRRTSTGRVERAVRPGRRAIRLVLTVPRTGAVVVQVVAGDRRWSTAAMVPVVAPPTVFSLRTTPALEPAFDPHVPDYTVPCPDGAVRVVADVPAGRGVAVDHRARRTAARLDQVVPLTAGQSFQLTVDGVRHTVRCRPADLPRWTVQRTAAPQFAWVLLAPSLRGGAPYAVIADRHGVPVWWMHAPRTPNDVKLTPAGDVLWTEGNDHVRHRLDGTDLGALPNDDPYPDGHDVQFLPNGDTLLISYVPHRGMDLSAIGGPALADAYDAEVREVAPDGHAVWTWSTADHIGLAETTAFGLSSTLTSMPIGPAYDLTHINSVQDDGDGVLVSARHLDAVYRIRKADGTIDWKLGGTPTPRSLAVVGDPHGDTRFGGQHDARLLADGTLTVHDNGSLRGRPPEALRYRIDPAARTATLLERITGPATANPFCCGSARRLAGGDWLMSWGATPVVAEVRPDGTPVLTLTMPGDVFSYRAEPVAAGVLRRSALHAGMDAMAPRPAP